MFTVDGLRWTLPCDIERVSEVKASDISGMLLNKNYFNDVIGTYLQYTVTLVVPFGQETQYALLYETLNQAVDAHTFTLPYNQETITITGRIQSISDVYRKLSDGSAHWTGIKFTVISNAPSKTHTLGQAIARGITPMPDIISPVVGAMCEYDGTHWNPVDYENADNKAY